MEIAGWIAVAVVLAAATAVVVRRPKSPAEEVQALIRKRKREMERNPKPDPPHDDSGFY